jgi:hypothetical protein
MTDDEVATPPDPRVFLIANGFTGIVAPGECGCKLDELMPCACTDAFRDRVTGLPRGCQGGYAHDDPRGGPYWVVSTKKEPTSVEAFDMWINAT